MAKKRFVVTYTQGTFEQVRVIVDVNTGVNYLNVFNGSGLGITPLLDAEGKPVVTPSHELRELK